jgi:27-O-demethylrifamycin SV methyltransferase
MTGSQQTGYDAAAHYDRVTDAWQLLLGDDLHYGVFDTGHEALDTATARLTELMVEAADLRPGMDILDVGCGTGAPACRLVESFGVRALGISTSSVGVAAATDRAVARGCDGARFEVRDGTATGLPDGSFDRVWLLESSHLIRDRTALIGECARVLRPGGRLVLCDIVRHRVIPFDEVRARRADFATLREAFGDAHMHSLDDYAVYLTAAGLTVGDKVDLSAATLPTFDRWRANAATHHEAVVDLLGTAGRDAFVRSTEILERFWRDGTLGYGLISADKALSSARPTEEDSRP